MIEEEFTLEVLAEFFDAVEAGVIAVKQRIARAKGLETPVVKEETFSILKYEQQTEKRTKQ